MPKPAVTFWRQLEKERKRHPVKPYKGSPQNNFEWISYHRNYSYILYAWRVELRSPRRQAYLKREFLKRLHLAEQTHQTELAQNPIPEWEFETDS